MDNHQNLRDQHRRRVNEQNQHFLRLQIQQKEDDKKLSIAEKQKHRDIYGSTAPEE